MSEWQPIETAPKDGTRVLLFRDGWAENTSVGYWNSDYEEFNALAQGPGGSSPGPAGAMGSTTDNDGGK